MGTGIYLPTYIWDSSDSSDKCDSCDSSDSSYSSDSSDSSDSSYSSDKKFCHYFFCLKNRDKT